MHEALLGDGPASSVTLQSIATSVNGAPTLARLIELESLQHAGRSRGHLTDDSRKRWGALCDEERWFDVERHGCLVEPGHSGPRSDDDDGRRGEDKHAYITCARARMRDHLAL